MKELEDVMEFTHFACTSEDINNLSHALQLQQCVQTELLATMDKVCACVCGCVWIEPTLSYPACNHEVRVRFAYR
jgi:hypothetical protein